MHYLIAVGSNLGDRHQALRRARELLPAGVRPRAVAPVLATPAFGGPRHSGPFLNTAWVVESAFGPHHLLWHLLHIEQLMGRARSQDHGPRRIDLDLLMAERPMLIDDAFLQLPHPRLHQRYFVLAPAVAIAGAWRHPVMGNTLQTLFQRLESSL